MFLLSLPGIMMPGLFLEMVIIAFIIIIIIFMINFRYHFALKTLQHSRAKRMAG